MADHPGQVACPGGKVGQDEGSLQAALREAEEELGIPTARVQPLGALHDIDVVVSGFKMTPWVGRVPADLQLRPHPGEVERAFYVPLDVLADTERSRFELRPIGYKGITYQVPYWRWDGELIWGATGRVLMDLLGLLYPGFPGRSSTE
jgi:8-oxo-dGTP pyrophosphatase MutT (NUDIX family)